MAQAQNPEQLKQLEQQYMQLKGNIEDEQVKPTREQVEQFLKDYRTTAFVLDIETDITIQADENAEKQRRGEFMGMLAQLLPQLAALIAQEPGSAEFCGELLKFSVAPFRVGRSLDGSIDNLVEQVEMKAAERVGKRRSQAGGRAEEDGGAGRRSRCRNCRRRRPRTQGKQQLEMAKLANENKIEMEKMQRRVPASRCSRRESKRQENMAKVQQTQAKMQQDAAKHQQTLVEGNQKMALQHASWRSRSRWMRRTGTPTWRSGARWLTAVRCSRSGRRR